MTRKRRRAYTGNASDLEQRDAARRFVGRDSDRRALVMQAQLGTYHGREFLWMTILACWILDPVQDEDETKVFQFLGRRAVGLELYTEVLQQYPEAFLLMQQEAIARQQRTDVLVAASAPATGDEAAL